MNAIRRGKSKLSGTPVKVNAYDLQRTIKYEDNRVGWRKFPTSIQRIFRNSPQKSCGVISEVGSGLKKNEKILFQVRRPNVIIYNRQRRSLNRAYELVGVELNPGPGGENRKGFIGPKNKPKKKNNKQKGRGANVMTTANGSILRRIAPNHPISSTGEKHSSEAGAYLRTVLAPCAGNARIPDLNTLPTALFTLSQEISTTVNASGIGGVVFSLISNNPSYSLENPATTTDAAFTYSASNTLTGNNSLANSYGWIRVVSACLDITYTGATLSDQGVAIGWTRSAFSGSLEVALGNVSQVQAGRQNQTHRVKDGISVFYRPNDAGSFAFKPTNGANNFGELAVHLTGLAASAPYMIKVTANFECIPSVDTISSAYLSSGSMKPSPVDISGYSKAVSYAAQVKPFATAQNAVNLTNSLASAGNNLMSIWNLGKQILGGMSYGTKMLI